MGDETSNTSSGQTKDFEKRLQNARETLKTKDQKQYRKGTAYSLGFRIVTDLVVAVCAGFLVGWGLDTWLGTSPWFLIVFTPLGIAAGISNVIRVAKSAEAQRHMDYISQTSPAPDRQDEDS